MSQVAVRVPADEYVASCADMLRRHDEQYVVLGGHLGASR